MPTVIFSYFIRDSCAHEKVCMIDNDGFCQNLNKFTSMAAISKEGKKKNRHRRTDTEQGYNRSNILEDLCKYTIAY